MDKTFFVKRFINVSTYNYTMTDTALTELDLLEKLINEKKVDRITNDSYNITIEVVAFENLKNHIEKRRAILGAIPHV